MWWKTRKRKFILPLLIAAALAACLSGCGSSGSGEQAPSKADPATPSQTVDAANTDTPAQPGCTISISCATILENMERCDPDKRELIPEDGWILEPVTVALEDGDSVFDVLQRVCRQNKIHLEVVETTIYGTAYIEGIANIYEFDAGELSGWRYSVNGWFPNYGSSGYQVQDGDVIEWVYTCDLGSDMLGETE